MLGRPTASIDTPAMTRTSARHMAASTRRRWRDPRASAGGRDGSRGGGQAATRAAGAHSAGMRAGAGGAGGGRATITRRWPTKQELVRASLDCERAMEKFVVTDDPRADVRTFLRRMAEDVSGAGAQTMLGFLASLRSDPEVADVYRETKIAQMHEHLRSRLAAELADDSPALDLAPAACPA